MSDLFDSHCHISADFSPIGITELAGWLSTDETTQHRFFGLMSSNQFDLELVHMLAGSHPQILPFFGIHPWYCHMFTTVRYDAHVAQDELKKLHYESILTPSPPQNLLDNLPEPINFDDYLESMGKKIISHQNAFVGEIGLDRLFRIPWSGYYGRSLDEQNESSKLSPCRVTLKHQEIIFQKQLILANKLEKPVSLHCVKAHGSLYDLVKKNCPNVPAIVLHSFTGSTDQAKMWLKTSKSARCNVFFSLSYWINGDEKKAQQLKELIELCTKSNLLIETDVGIDSLLPKNSARYFNLLESILLKISELKNWTTQETREILLENWNNIIIRSSVNSQ